MGFLTTLLVIAYASTPSIALSISRPVWARATNKENVILADCTGENNDLSSEASYFASSPDESPDDIATVATGRHHDWANTTTTAFYSDTGTTFKAVLGPKGNPGDYAGTGNNGYGNFTCWQMDPTYLYNHANKNCYAIYECNHLEAPVALPSETPSAIATPSPGSTASNGSGHSGLTVGAIVGLSIGVAIGALLFIGAVAFLLWRRWQSKKEAKEATGSEGKGPGGAVSVASEMPKDSQAEVAIWQGPGSRELETPTVYHELHHEERPVEAQSEAIRGELDASPAMAELHSEDLPPRYHHEGSGSPGAYGEFKGPRG